MFFDRPFLKKQLDSNEKLLWYGRTAVFFSHWGVPVWILMIPAVFFQRQSDLSRLQHVQAAFQTA